MIDSTKLVQFGQMKDSIAEMLGWGLNEVLIFAGIVFIVVFITMMAIGPPDHWKKKHNKYKYRILCELQKDGSVQFAPDVTGKELRGIIGHLMRLTEEQLITDQVIIDD